MSDWPAAADLSGQLLPAGDDALLFIEDFTFLRSGMILINVTVGDENDNAPSFQQPLYSVRVPESAAAGIMLTRVKAIDRDSGNNGLVKYSISPESSVIIRSTFTLNELSGLSVRPARILAPTAASH